MRWFKTTARGITAALAFGSALLAAAPAYAADGGLTVTVRATDPLAPVVTLTNGGTEPCQVAATGLGTLTITALTQDNRSTAPIVFTPGFDEPLTTVIAQQLRTLDPGQSIDLKLQVVPAGPTGHALEDIAYTGPIATTGLLYPVRAGMPLELSVTYALPIAVESGPPPCQAAGPSGDAPPTAQAAPPSTGDRLLWIGVAAGVLVLLILVVWLLRRRRRGAAVAALLLLAALGAPGWQPRAAEAVVQVADPALQGAYDSCIATLQQPGHDPAGILPTLLGPGVTVILEAPTDGVTHEGGASTSLMIIYWNPDDRHAYVGSGGTADPCTSLYHEMYHAYEDSRGGQDHHECITAGEHHTSIGINEVNATRAQNQLRAALGLPERDHYGTQPLPTGECRPSRPTDPRCTGKCPQSKGEPHLVTLAGRRYDFQAAGEFIALQDPAGGFTVQVRQRPYGDSKTLAVNTAVAMDVTGDRVEVDLTPTGVAVLIGGVPRPDTTSGLDHGGQVRIGQREAGPVVSVTWPDGSTVYAYAVASVGLNLSVDPVPAHADAVGLFAEELRTRDGAALPGDGEPSYEALYPAFADSWRITDATSLFTYPEGRNTATYTDRSFPQRESGPEPDTAAAKEICARAGVTAPDALADCVYDVSHTGHPAFAASALAGQIFATGPKAGDTVMLPATADVYLGGPGEVPSLPGGAGTRPLTLRLNGAAVATFPLVEGELGPAGGEPADGADGGTQFPDTEITGRNGISGIVHHNRSLFLVGVFLPATASAQTPAAVDVTGQGELAELKPNLGELFAIGDGRTGAGALQRFVAPAGAGSLVIGFADASSFHGDPGFYADNTGSLAVRVDIG
ncbi:M91 family zinc metallopeptidase [Catellatospora tritici]|uniref:M91 family zinc metallopeptidase n=1 Tax=Catellatospora tritici TaxID=2851566 RepID=UPI001C2D1293|nr:M91 family zinc metallopeptidase [Catellatospora tritici]MBV1853826.1 LPXTG cell wall anchor domain-containing protein [Catellatospora tritici]